MTAKLASLQVVSDDADWVDVPDLPGVSLQVRPSDYAPYQIARDNLLSRFRRKYGLKTIPDKELKPAIGRVLAEHILVDWRGFDEPYSKESALSMLGSWSWRKLIDAVAYAAAQRSEVELEFTEDAEKNSAEPSATT